MTEFTIESSRGRVVVDSYGAYIRTLRLLGTEVLMKSGDNSQTHGGCATLIPFANRVRSASYKWRGRNYRLPKNSGENSIHGFTKEMDWEVKQENGSLVLSTTIDGEDYPTILECQSTISLTDNSLSIKIEIFNTGDYATPLSIGLHPYFIHDGRWRIKRPSSLKMLNYVDSYFPDGTMTNIDSKKLSSKGKTEFDNCFYVGPNLILETATHEVSIRTENMDYFVIYNGDYSNGDSVAIEPMTSAPDAFNNRIGLVTLRPNSKFYCSAIFSSC
ncbi:MAG: aldose 1-epimerase [Candidatus Thermoplasmatota archaeon]|nr:aldose 1-epimerase [Candidatus Thermoplasmatota archaeon]MCL6003036.1 aldose 1-epimerase [Candidatus Thermoplasmatota archaeon]